MKILKIIKNPKSYQHSITHIELTEGDLHEIYQGYRLVTCLNSFFPIGSLPIRNMELEKEIIKIFGLLEE